MRRALCLSVLLLAGPSWGSDDEARLLSLPYLAGKLVTSDADGVTVYDPERADPGVNLYVSAHAPEVFLVDMEGEVLHRWRYEFRRAFRGKRESVETGFLRRARLLEDGDLLAIYQGGGMVRLDAGSRLLWAADAGFYNDFDVAADGTIYAIGKAAKIDRAINTTQPVLEDSILVLSADGEIERRVPLLPCFRASPFAALLEPMARSGDVSHTNTVEILGGAAAALHGWPAGSVLVSLRQLDLVAVVDLERETVLWARRGPWVAQHQPTLLANGRILLFDNRGAAGRSRALEIDPDSGEVVWSYGELPGQPLVSAEAGSVQRLANGNTLITESERGRAVEVTPTGEIVWELRTPHRMPQDDRFVATLLEVVRLDPSAARFLE